MPEAKRVAFITGGNRGIGLRTALELGQQGFDVVIGVRDVRKGDTALAELKRAGVAASLVLWDAERPDTDSAVKGFFETKYGKLDVLVNNAGMIKEELLGNRNASSVPVDVVRETFEINVFSVIRLTQALLPLIRRAPAGRVVNLSSVLGSLNLHAAENSPIAQAKAFAYNASKTALNAFTVHLADELKDTPIKVNSAHPGWVKTELGGPHAPGAVEDSARTTVRLALLGPDGPSGGFFHEAERLPW